MKIYFDGCSWTEGAELEKPEEERFSRLVCQEFDAEEKNISQGGGSNERIIRNMMVSKNIEEYDKKEKAKQQKSKVLGRKPIKRKTNKEKNITL